MCQVFTSRSRSPAAASGVGIPPSPPRGRPGRAFRGRARSFPPTGSPRCAAAARADVRGWRLWSLAGAPGPVGPRWDFRASPRATPAGAGQWSGTHTGGDTISFSVVNRGREAFEFVFAWSPEFRCADGSAYRCPSYVGGSELAWIRRDGSFSLRDAEDDRLLTMHGSVGADSGNGSFRIVETHPDPRGACDTGPVGFTASRSP
jgi:hypothetical protein